MEEREIDGILFFRVSDSADWIRYTDRDLVNQILKLRKEKEVLMKDTAFWKELADRQREITDMWKQLYNENKGTIRYHE